MRSSVSRRRQLVAFMCLVAVSVGAGSAPAAAATRPGGPLALPTGSYFGALVNPDRSTPSSTPAEVASLEERIGRGLDIVNHFYTYPQAVGTQGEVQDVAAGRIPMITWGATDADSVLNGSQDAYITQQAVRLRNLGAPVFLRYFHEPEGAYRAPLLDSADEYVATWKYARRLFEAAGATNVVWVFTTTAYSFRVVPQAPPWKYYPGDGFVDWIAGDGYNFAPVKPGAKWNAPATVFGKWYAWASNPGLRSDDLFTVAKPLMIAEYGALEDPNLPGRKAGWYDQLRSTVKTGYPLVQAVIAWSTANTKGGLVYNWNVDSTPSSLAAWRNMGLDPYFHPTP